MWFAIHEEGAIANLTDPREKIKRDEDHVRNREQQFLKFFIVPDSGTIVTLFLGVVECTTLNIAFLVKGVWCLMLTPRTRKIERK